MLLTIGYKPSTKEVLPLENAEDLPGDFLEIGSFNHPDLVYPDSVVIYHGVRDLLYKRSAAVPSNFAMYPNNICNMQEITILPVQTAAVVVPHFTTQPPATIDLSEATGFIYVDFDGFASDATLIVGVYDSADEFVGSTSASGASGQYAIPYMVIGEGTGFVVRVTDTTNNVDLNSNPFDIVA